MFALFRENSFLFQNVYCVDNIHFELSFLALTSTGSLISSPGWNRRSWEVSASAVPALGTFDADPATLKRMRPTGSEQVALFLLALIRLLELAPLVRRDAQKESGEDTRRKGRRGRKCDENFLPAGRGTSAADAHAQGGVSLRLPCPAA